MEAPLLCPENSYRRSTGDVCLECSSICLKIKDLDSTQQNACAKICKNIINSTIERNIVKSTIETTNVMWITTDNMKKSDLGVGWIIFIVISIISIIGIVMAVLYMFRGKIEMAFCNWKHGNKFSDTCRYCRIKRDQGLHSNPRNGNELAVNDEEQGLMKNNSNNININMLEEAFSVNSPLIPDDNYVTSDRGDHYSVIPQNIEGDNSKVVNENEARNLDDTNIQNSLVSQEASKNYDIPIAQCSRGQSEHSILAIEEDNPSSTLVLPFTERQLSSAAAESSQISELEK